ncbi:hypothetical protein B0H19DRAFT_1245551 [Mycena capillaripes]|nr:hypothetical protein B0H19DRAFT_1245551 [Mycena capillaripes]
MMLHILAFLPILSIAAHTNNPDDCTSRVKRIFWIADGGEASTICTNALVNSQALCYGCEVKVAAITQEKAQSQLDKYIAGCKANGFAVDSFTVSPDKTGLDDSAGSDSTDDSTSTTTAPAAPTISAIPPATSRVATGDSGTTPVFSGGAPAASSPARSASGSAPAQSVASNPQPQTGGAERLSAGIMGAALALGSLAFGLVI